MTAEINGSNYHIQFSYRRTMNHARHPHINGVTACAIVSDRMIAVGAAVCSADDNWSRLEGRKQAFLQAVMSCGPMYQNADAFYTWFAKHTKQPVKPREVTRISQEEKQRRIEAGEEKRRTRRVYSGLGVSGANG